MMIQTALLNAIATQLDGKTGIGEVIVGALSEVDATPSTATVSLEYGLTVAIDQVNQRRTASLYDSQFTFYADLYWNGQPADWQDRIFDQAYAEVWRQIMTMALPSGVLRIFPDGHDQPETSTEGDRQHIMLRSSWLAYMRHSLTDPEA